MHPERAALAAILDEVRRRADAYVASVDERRVFPPPAAIAALEQLDHPWNDQPADPLETVRLLADIAGPATVATTGPRYFGFVTGGTLPAATGAGLLTTLWDQPSPLWLTSPPSAEIERIVVGWMIDLFGLPSESVGALVTCATMASFTGLAAARHAILARAGWDVEADGLFGAPEIEVIVGDEVHSTVLKALAMLGLGKRRLTRVPTDAQGRMIAAKLPKLGPRSLVCIQAGNVNTGAFDPAREIGQQVRAAGAWMHVDGAFGLWTMASPALRHLCDGVELGDSWATDGHKWLNVGYDCGMAFVRDGAALVQAMSAPAAYLIQSERRDGMNFTPDSSRRARSFEVWAALRSLGRSGLAALVDRCCAHARRFAAGLRAAGIEVPHDVVINQVMARFGDDARTDRVIRAIQEDGTLWAGRTEWQGRTYMRISVSNWSTTEADIDRSLAAILRLHSATP